MKQDEHIDQDEVCYSVAEMLSVSPEGLSDAVLNQFLSLPANRLRVSQRMGFPRVKFNRWYKTTFLNQLNEKISAADKQIIKFEVSSRLERGECVTRDFKAWLRSRLSREYYKPIFDMQISNTIQVWKRAHVQGPTIDVSVLKQLAAAPQ